MNKKGRNERRKEGRGRKEEEICEKGKERNEKMEKKLTLMN